MIILLFLKKSPERTGEYNGTMSELKTIENDAGVYEFIDTLENETQKQDSLALLDIFRSVTDEEPRMWGGAIIGFGKYHYKSERSSQQGDWPLTAFSPRKQSLTLYIMEGFEDHTGLLEKLGKHTKSLACLYIKRLSDVDRSVLEELIRVTYLDMKQKHQ